MSKDIRAEKTHPSFDQNEEKWFADEGRSSRRDSRRPSERPPSMPPRIDDAIADGWFFDV